jgi:16S rRNA (cytosine967-C5)-methyltransferase
MLAAAIGSLQALDRPADSALRAFFRAHPALGQRDRALVAEGVFTWLRRKRSLEAFADCEQPGKLALAVLAREFGHSTRELRDAVGGKESEWLAARKSAPVALSPAARADVPEWLWEKLGAFLDVDEREALTRIWQKRAPLDLRVNSMSAKRDEVRAALAQDGISAEPTPYSPLGLRLAEKPALQKHPLFTSGQIEVQDEGSQLLGYLVAPKRHDMVVDFCAGAGGKTLLLGALMHSQGRLYAFDTSEKRLANLKPRLQRSGLSNIHPQLIAHERDTKVRRLAKKIDRVLVDAPCSGLGTLRRNPDLKWRQNPEAIAQMNAKQARILAAAATLVKPGGRLVYATCSVLPQENAQIVDAFLREHTEFTPLDAWALLAAAGIDIARHTVDVGDARYLQLWPHVHHCDGFFAAVLERSRAAA